MATQTVCVCVIVAPVGTAVSVSKAQAAPSLEDIWIKELVCLCILWIPAKFLPCCDFLGPKGLQATLAEGHVITMMILSIIILVFVRITAR